ncbi:MAG: HYR domain-containing protein, partial [Lutibacter sp.]|nr:HYR domain-containing protein [Lutibacter sp.]
MSDPTCSFTVTLNDKEKPTIVGLPTNISFNNEVNSCGAVVSWAEPTASDNCDSAPSISYVSSPTTGLTLGNAFPIGTTTITYTATDADGNINTGSFSVIVTDNQFPVINCVSDISQNIDAGTCGAVINYTAPVGTDNCSGLNTLQTAGLVSGSLFPVGTTINTFEVTDASGNTASCSFNVTIKDNENPTIVNLPANISVDNDAGSCGAIVNWTTPTAADNCIGSTILKTGGLTKGGLFPVGVSTITYKATDASGNFVEESFTVTVIDSQIPVIVGCPSNITKSTDAGVCSAVVSWTEPSVTDNCKSSGNIVWTKSHTPGTVFPVGTTVVTYTAKDVNGNNSATCTFNVTVKDIQKPIISGCPANIIKNTDTGSCGAIVTWVEPTATDNCTSTGNLVWTKSHTSGATFPVGTTTVTYTAADEAGNVSNTCSFNVIISDKQFPIASCLSPTIYLNTSGVATLTVSDVNNGSSDNCTPTNALIIKLSKTTFNCTNKGVNTVEMSVKDASGNIATCQSTVTVVDSSTPTLIATSGTVTSVLNTDAGACSYKVKGSELDPIGSDNCTGTTLTYSVTGATTISGTSSLAGVTLLKGDNVISWTVSDGTNTSVPLVFTKTVKDNQAPSVTTVGSKYRGTTAGVCDYQIIGTEFDATYSDNCSVVSVSYTINSEPTVVSSTLSGVTLSKGINNIVWTVSDGVNEKSSSFRVTVTDNKLPIISLISDITEIIPLNCVKVVNWVEPIASDNCSVATFTQTKGLKSGSEFPVGTSIITYTAVDNSGNSTTMSFNVIVKVAPPGLVCPTETSFNKVADSGCSYIVKGTEFDATTADGCAFTVETNSFDGTSTLAGKELPVGNHNIIWTAVDQFDNISTCTINITVTDDQNPTFEQPKGSYTKNADPAKCYYTIVDTSFDLKNINDNCKVQPASFIIAKNGVTAFTGTKTLAGIQLPSDETHPYSIVWTLADVNGNSVVADAFTISVKDSQAPTFECYGNETRNIPIADCSYTINGSEFDPKLLSDNCDASGDLKISYTLDGVSGGTSTTLDGIVLNGGVHPVVWTLTDTKGNSASCNFNIIITDLVVPTISAIVNQTRNAPITSCSYTAIGTEFDPATVTDNCPSVTLKNNLNGLTTLNGYVFPVGITVVVWTAKDSGGNIASSQFQVEIKDVAAPEYKLINTTDAVVSITKSSSTTSCFYTTVGTEFDPQAIEDNCTSNNYTIINNKNNYRSLAYVEFPVGTTDVSWSVKDNYGNETIKTLQITVVDNVKPVITCPSNAYTRVYDKGLSYYAVGTNEFKPIVKDNCGLASYNYVLSGATTSAGSSLTGVHLNEGVNTIEWTATDTASPANTEVCSITVNVVSDLYPSITCVGDQSKSTSPAGDCSYTVSGTEFNATSTSAGATLINDFNNSATLAGAVFPHGTTFVTWTASQTVDGTLYTNDCSFYVFVNDNEKPVITPPADVTTTNINYRCTATGVDLGTPITTDNCGVLEVWNNQNNNTFPLGVNTVTWWVRDIHGNTASATQKVTVVDDDAPTFNCVASICREVDEGKDYYTVFDHEFKPYNIYDCSGYTITNNINNSSSLVGYQFPKGTTEIIWTITDKVLPTPNVSTCTTTITINNDDPPSVTCRGNQTKNTDTNVCTYTVKGTEFDISTTSGTTLTYTLSGATTATGNSSLASQVFNKGTTTVSWTATNGANNNVCCTYNVYVYDNQDPVVTWPANVIVDVDTESCTATNVVVGTPTATDNCDAPAQINYTKSTNSTSFNVGVTNIYWTATDTRGNDLYHTQTVTVTDSEAPVITCPTETYYREYTNPYVDYYYVVGSEFTPAVSDNCTVNTYTNNLTETGYLNGIKLAIGDHKITWTATDVNPGTPNKTTCDVNVTIVDSFVPSIKCPSGIISEKADTGACTYTIPVGTIKYDATFESLSGDNRTMTHNIAGAPLSSTLAGAEIPKGTNTITWTATQTIGGVEYSNTCSFNFTVTDLEPPVLDEPFEDVVENVDVNSCTKIYTLTPPTAKDNCSIPTAISITNNAPATFIVGTTNVRWELKDEAGNSTIYFQKVTINDNEAPVISNCPSAAISASATGNNCQVNVSWPALVATDACSGVKSFTTSHAPGSLFDAGTTTVTYTATDNNGNISTCSFNVVVADTPPTISCVENKTRSANSGTCSYKVLGNEFDPLTFNDNCTVPTLTWSFINPDTSVEVKGNKTLSGVSIPRGYNNGVDTGKITINWTATDSGGQTTTCSFVLTITDDEGPILVVPGNQTRSTDENKNYYTVKDGEFDDVTAMDNCGIVTKLVNVFDVSTLNGLQMQMGENKIAWIATDDSGNIGSANFYAFIVDTELPRLETAPTNISVDAGTGCSAPINYTVPTFIDNVTSQAELAITVLPAEAVSGYEFPVGKTTVTYKVVDKANNILSYSFDVIVTDNLAPTIVCPAGDVDNQFNRNTDTGKATYTTIGTEFDSTSFSDNCIVTIENNYNNDDTLANETFPIGTTVVVWTATDESGNATSCTIEVVVADIEPPVISECADTAVSRNNDLGNCYFTVTTSEYDPYNLNDNAITSKLTYSINGSSEVGTDVNTSLVGVQIPVGKTTVFWRLYDASDNVSTTCSTVFTVTDIENPKLVPIATQTRNVDAGLATYTAKSPSDDSWNIPVLDNCGVAKITYQINGGSTVGTDTTTSIIGENFTVGTYNIVWEATDVNGNKNTGSYQVIIEDKEAPTAVCNSLTVNLDTTGSYSLTTDDIAAIALGSSDPSGIVTYEVSPNSFNCIDTGENTVTLTLTDIYGNVSTCNAIVTVKDVTPPTVVCKPITALYLDAFGNATITASDINNGSSDICGIASISASKTTFDCTNVGSNNVTLTVTDVNGNSSTCTTTVTILDDVIPVAVCKNTTVSLDANGNVTITGLDIDNGSYDNCFSTLVRTATPSTFTCNDIGTHEVTLTVTDPAGNSDTCIAIVTIEDSINPIAIAQDITVQLDDLGNATITADQINNGSNDACGIKSIAIDKTTFDCSNIGANTVTLTVTDNNNNVATTTAVVTVEDSVLPIITCTTDKVVTTTANVCIYTHNNSSWNATAIDVCGSVSSLTYALSGATTLANAPANTSLNSQVFNKGITTVTWTAIDGSLNEAQCSFTVTVKDEQKPNAICQNITIQLNAFGNASITVNDIDDGSNDNCGIQSIVASKTNFTCADYGPNNVLLTVTDTSNNTETCTAIVTVQDLIDPVAVCSPLTIQLNASGNYTLNTADINTISAGSTDNCSIVTSVVSPNTFDCENVGSVIPVTLTVTDIAGNIATCATTVTVEDKVKPTAICQNITVQLDAFGKASIAATDIDNRSSDACGIANLSIDKTAFTCLDIGTNSVTLTVTDNNGNISTCVSTVTILDTEVPKFTLCSSAQSQFTDSGTCTFTKTATDWDATATDNCSVTSLTYKLTGATVDNTGTGTSLNGVAFNKGITTITWTAVDASGNKETCSYTLTVTDNENPTAIAKTATVALDRSGTVIVLPAAIDNTSTDNCGIVTYEISKTNSNYGTEIEFDCEDISTNPNTVWLKVTDAAGNSHVTSTTVTVQDTQAPTVDAADISNLANVTDPGNCTFTYTGTNWNPTDNCDTSPTITYSANNGASPATGTSLTGVIFQKGTTTVTWQTEDATGNTDTIIFDVVVTDAQKPTIAKCSSNITKDVATAGAASVAVAGIVAPEYADNCAVTELTWAITGAGVLESATGSVLTPVTGDTNPLEGFNFKLGTSTITYTVFDAVGNLETCNFTITVNALPTNTVIVSETAIITNEDLGTATFTVVLPFAPTGTVVFDVSSSDLTEGTVDKAQLTFNATNWDKSQTVTVKGVNDNVDDGDIPYTIILKTNKGLTDDLSGYENVDPADVSATNIDNDTVGISVSTISRHTNENGQTATFTVVLNTEPTHDVTITLSSSDTTESDLFGIKTLTFTPANWATKQTVTVKGKDDAIVDGNVAYTILTSNASSSDPKYNDLVAADVAVINDDNDTAGFIVTPITLTTTEAGGTATFTVVLTSKPGTDSDQTQVVVVDVASNDLTEGIVDLSQLTFTNLNWNTPQTVTVTGVDDILVDGTISYTILNTVNVGSTTDTNYDGLNPADVSVNNTDNDSAQLSINSITVDEGNTGTTNFTFEVKHSGAEVVGGYSVSFYTQNGVAKAPSDFTGNGGSINFTTGAIGETKTITIAVNGDTAVERNETFNVVLNSVTAPGKNITINPAAKTGIGTITNDDNATLSIGGKSIDEGNSGTKTLTFNVTLSMAVEDGLSVDYTTANGTALTTDSDYVAKSGKLKFTGTAGEIQTISVTINGDEKVELDETFLVNLSNIVPVSAPVAAISFAEASAVGTIKNDDTPTVAIVNSVTHNEGNSGTTSYDFTVTLSKISDAEVKVDYTTADVNATIADSDYVKKSGTLTFAPGETSKTITVLVNGNTKVELNETFTVELSNLVTNGRAITFGNTTGTGTITNDDSASLAINDVIVDEAAGTARFTVTLTGEIQEAVTFNYAAANISPITASDYTLTAGTITFEAGSVTGTEKYIDVTIKDDVIAEPTETYNINLTGLNASGQTNVSFSIAVGLGTITDNDIVHLTLNGFTVTETNGTQIKNFYVSRNIASQSAITLKFSTSNGTATSTSDYTIQTNVNVSLSAASTVNVNVANTTIAGDLIAEPTETFTGTITINNKNNQQVEFTTSGNVATATINDNDIVNITLEDKPITETDGTQTVNYVVNTNIAAQKDIVLNYATTDGSALNGVLKDYITPAYTTITIPAGKKTLNIPISVLGDLITEPQETYTAAITENNYNAQQVVLTRPTATYTIDDNDLAELSIAGFTIDESEVGTVTAEFTITLSKNVQNAFTVDFATSNIGTAIGNALAGSDYTAVGTTTLNFGAGNPLVQKVTVTINNDDLVEPSETLLGTLSNLVANSQAVTIPTPTATSTITDNDAASVVINDKSVSEIDGTAVFTVTLTGHIQDALTVDYTTNNGTGTNPAAVQPSDYTLTSGTVTFPAGSITGATQIITVPIINNDITEPLNEQYTVDLSTIVSTGSASITRAQGLGTITDDDSNNKITLTGFTVAETNGNVNHNFVATLDYEAQEPVIISFTTTNGTATATDFNAQSAIQYTILPGDLFVNIPVNVLGDQITEPQESFSGAITLVNVNGQQVTIGTATATSIINDDDNAVISIAGFTVNEDAGTADFTITSSLEIQNEVTVIFSTSNGSALSVSDYDAIFSKTLTFGGGNTNPQTVSVTITDDLIAEPTKLFSGILSSLVTNSQNVTLNSGPISTAIGTIKDNDEVTLTIDDVTKVEVDAGSTVNYVFKVTHNGSSTDGPFSVNYTTANIDALAGADYVTKSGIINFSGTVGEIQTITIVVNGDNILEPTETFTVNLSEKDFGARQIIFSEAKGLGTITDNDETTVSVIANIPTASEPNTNGQFTVNIGLVSSTETVISYTISGTATPATDYATLTGTVTIPAGSSSKTIDVLVVNDAILEASETVIVTLNAITSGDANISIGTTKEATVTINDEDVAKVSIIANDPSASEPSNNGQFTISISNASDVDTVVSYSVAGTANSGSDYTALTGTVTIPAGSESATINVTVLDDVVLEGSETVIVTLEAITSGDNEITIDDANKVATVTITDNDAASLSINDVVITEGEDAVFTVTLTGAVQGGFSINYATADGSATILGNDYTSGSNTLSFTGTAAESKTIKISTNDDNYLEAVENFVLNLSTISNALVTYDSQATITLNDNDAASLTVSDVIANEGDNTVFRVTLTGNVQGGVSIDYATANNSAFSSSDYTTTSGTLNFTGTTPESFTITVPTTEDDIAEPNENFYLNFSNSSNALVTSDAQAIGTITDDDVYTISIADNSIVETESAQKMDLLVTMNGVAQEDVVLSFSTTAVSATATTDFIAQTAATYTIKAGESSVTIPVSILGDLIAEPIESFTGTITINNANSQQVTIGTGVGTATATI